MNKLKTVAFVGLGKMGVPMAQRLMDAGYDVIGVDASEAGCGAFEAVGGRATTSPTDAVQSADIVVTMLPNGKVVADVVHRIVSEIEGRGVLVVDMSSSAPADTRALADALPETVSLIDAPVSGGVKRAVSGDLTIMAGGAKDDLSRAMPMLDVLGNQVIHCGPIASGHAVKAINNFVSASGLVAAVEALQLARAFGVEGDTLVDALNGSSGQNNATLVKMKPFVLSETFGSGFAAGLMAKDIGIAADLSRDLGLDLDLLQRMERLWAEAVEALGGDADHTRIAEYVSAHSRAKA
ncbi:NAD(P)-dependent oxidoreductase [Stappia indica]|uniref:NAD(P)-dependent oxidoreductase n=1 Tax=Stappia indica TaxID=538381 RepID=UPI001CD2B330|nr:NAD(P)-dependent oxidoreductase [Stappia indica]MCA1300194.1 NAD(P)-dependent oxidoreductase [Stappia indica]